MSSKNDFSTDSVVKEYIDERQLRIKKAQQEAREMLIGRTVEITSDYNGQPYGKSKPSLKGTPGKVVDMAIDGDQTYLWIKQYYCGYPGIRIDEVRFIR